VRYAFRTAAFSTQYPFNRFTRAEFGLQANFIGRSIINENYDWSTGGIGFEKVGSLGSLNFVSPIVAFVTDNTLFGITGPISGRRMRVSAAPALGNVRWVDYLFDYRRYDPIIFNTLTFATRLYSNVTVGRDEELFPKYIGTPEFVRGYDRSSLYSGYSCDAILGAPNSAGSACATTQLVGTRVAVFNEELRFPIIRRFDLGSLPIGLPPVDGAMFFDAGLAWSAGQKVSLTKPDNYDYTLQRYVMRSWGFGLRVNLFNLALLKWDYAKPIDRDNSKWNWTFSLGPTF
jgi:outer membrane protein assembly factor BamA